MEHKGVRYEVRIGIARDQWRVAIYIPDKRLPVERTVFGTREDAETTARSMINAWLKKKSGAACPLPAARFPPVTSDLHPRVYAVLIGLSLWSVAWVWSFFGTGVTPLLLFVVSGFIGVVIALWLILRSVRRPTEIANSNTDQPPSFHDWVRGDFNTEHGLLSSAHAAIIILLPIVAAAIGMMVFGIEFQIVEHAM
jgi:hypothetical protein